MGKNVYGIPLVMRYVPVSVEFDSTGSMKPTEIGWQDGRRFRIDKVLDVTKAGDTGPGVERRKYRVIVRGEEKNLFFEVEKKSAWPYGRWFVEV